MKNSKDVKHAGTFIRALSTAVDLLIFQYIINHVKDITQLKIVTVGLFFMYFVFIPLKFDRTVGQIIFELKIVDINLDEIPFILLAQRVFLLSFSFGWFFYLINNLDTYFKGMSIIGMLLPLLIIFISIGIVLFTSGEQTLFDKLSHTQISQTRTKFEIKEPSIFTTIMKIIVGGVIIFGGLVFIYLYIVYGTMSMR